MDYVLFHIFSPIQNNIISNMIFIIKLRIISHTFFFFILGRLSEIPRVKNDMNFSFNLTLKNILYYNKKKIHICFAHINFCSQIECHNSENKQCK